MTKKPKEANEEFTVTKITLDDLPNAEKTQVVAPRLEIATPPPESVPTPAPKKVTVNEALKKFEQPSKPTPVKGRGIEKIPPKVSLDVMAFDRSFTRLYLMKLLSFLFAAVLFEVAAHFIRFYDGVDVMDLNNFRSIIFTHQPEWNGAKILGLLLFTLFMTSTDRFILGPKGILCHKVNIMRSIYTTDKVFLEWEKVAKVEPQLRLFEPFLFFYDAEGKELGFVDFTLKDRGAFNRYVKETFPKEHPLRQMKGGPA